jgi:hypothetical protein
LVEEVRLFWPGTSRLPENAKNQASREPLDITDHGTHPARFARHEHKVHMVGHDHIGKESEAIFVPRDSYLVKEDLARESISQEGNAMMCREGDEARPTVVIPMSQFHHVAVPDS